MDMQSIKLTIDRRPKSHSKGSVYRDSVINGPHERQSSIATGSYDIISCCNRQAYLLIYW